MVYVSSILTIQKLIKDIIQQTTIQTFDFEVHTISE